MKFLFYLLFAGIAFDLAILGVVVMQVAYGIDTPHIGFWDSQLRFIGYIIK